MQAIWQREFGGPEVLVLEDRPDPVAGPGQVRIRVGAAGVHLVDATIRRGESGGPFPLPQLPMVPGREVAGVVDAVGEGVDEAWLGRRAVAHLGMASGGYAELAVREVDAVHEIPAGLTDEAAVAMIGTGRTTMAILEVGPIGAGDVVLVTAAAGGIGNLLVQAGLAAGAVVVGLAGGAAKVRQVQALGATHAVDYTDDAWPREVAERLGARRPTIAYDTVGGSAGEAAMTLLAPGGHLVLAGFSSGRPGQVNSRDIISGGISVSATIGPRIAARPGGMRDLELRALAAAAGGTLRPLINPPLALADAAAAHAALETRHTAGKVVLRPVPSGR